MQKLYNEMLPSCNNSAQFLRSFASFLLDIVNDSNRVQFHIMSSCRHVFKSVHRFGHFTFQAQQLLSRADTLESAEVAGSSANGGGEGGQQTEVDDASALFDDRVGVFQIRFDVC